MLVRCKMPVRCALLKEEQDVGQNGNDKNLNCIFSIEGKNSHMIYESIATVGEIRVWWRADFQSGSRVLKKVF